MEFKDFWIFSKKEFSFPDFHTCKDQGFLDVLSPEIFKLSHNGFQGFLKFSLELTLINGPNGRRIVGTDCGS